MASIKKMSNGKYQATVYIGRDENGKVLRKYITRDGWKECRDAARELEEEVANKNLNNLSMMQMDAYMDKWFEVNKVRLAPTTRKEYKRYIDKHFKPFFKKDKVHQVTEMNIKEYIAEKLEYLSSTTVRKHFFTLSSIFYDALKTKSPCIGIKAPPNAPYTPYIPSEAEFQEIHDVFRKISLEDEIIVLLAGWCGLRRGEIFAIKLDDINEDEGTIKIDEAVALKEKGYKFEFKQPKSVNGIRTIAVPDYLMELINVQKKILRKSTTEGEVISLDKKKNKNILLCTQNPHSFTKKYARIRVQEDLPPARFHDLRHYHASLLYKYNVPDQYAAERLGHDIWVLKKIYQHLGLEERKELDNKVKNIFNNKA